MKNEPLYPTYGKPNPNAGIHVVRGYPRWHWWDKDSQKVLFKYLHIWVWEQCNGPVPVGYVVHHVNGDPGDYRVENLEPKTRKQHQVLHLGTKVVDGKQTCSKCDETKSVEEFPVKGSGRRSVCRDCWRAYHREKFAANPEERLAANRKWRSENRDKVLEMKKQYREKNQDKTKVTLAAWYEKNKEEYNRKRREAWAARKTREDAIDCAIAEDRLKEIEENPECLVGGEELERQLAALDR